MPSKKSLSDEIKASILSQHFTDGEKLPSVRKMAANLGVSTGSIVKIYNELEKEGFVKSYSGKGCFWGTKPIGEQVSQIVESDSLEQKFEQDLESGYLNSLSALPSLKELSIHYETSLYHLRRFMSNKVKQGILKKNGIKYFFNEEKEIERNNFIYFVHRSDRLGHFFIDSEREVEVFRTLTQLACEKGISVKFVGYCEKENRLIGSDSKDVFPEKSRWCLGAFISTWLVSSPSVLFSHFAKCTFPISVWWENSVDILAKITSNREKWAYYNVAFGKNIGKIVGDYLRKKNIRAVNYLSPFHNSDWSKKRLDGLRQAGLEVKALVNTRIFSPFEVSQKAVKQKTSPQEYLKSLIRELLPEARPQPFVCANDWVAAVLIEIFEEEGRGRPYVIGFDNTTESYRYSFDSFAFNVETMVKEALYHIISPSKYAFFKKQVQNPPGKVVVKG